MEDKQMTQQMIVNLVNLEMGKHGNFTGTCIELRKTLETAEIGTAFSFKSNNPYHDCSSTFEKIEKDVWMQTYTVNGKIEQSTKIDERQAASEIANEVIA